MMRVGLLLAVMAIASVGQALAQSSPAPLPPGTVIERRTYETTQFSQSLCGERPNGYYCGTGTNRQLLYQCINGQNVNDVSCPGGCNPATLSCAQEFGVKGIDPPKPQ